MAHFEVQRILGHPLCFEIVTYSIETCPLPLRGRGQGGGEILAAMYDAAEFSLSPPEPAVGHFPYESIQTLRGCVTSPLSLWERVRVRAYRKFCRSN